MSVGRFQKNHLTAAGTMGKMVMAEMILYFMWDGIRDNEGGYKMGERPVKVEFYLGKAGKLIPLWWRRQ